MKVRVSPVNVSLMVKSVSMTGVNQAPKVLDAMAVAGQADDGRHYAVEDLAQIQQRLTAVAGSIAPCTWMTIGWVLIVSGLPSTMSNLERSNPYERLGCCRWSLNCISRLRHFRDGAPLLHHQQPASSVRL